MGALRVLRGRDFGLFFTGYSTSLLGSSMSSVAMAFAVLDGGGSASELGFVLAAVPVTQLLFMLFGGVIADWFGPRRIMLAGDTIRCVAQSALAIEVLVGRPGLWTFTLLAAVRGVGEALFNPALSVLVVRTVPSGHLGDANVLLGFSQSVAKVAGPTLAGVFIAISNAGTVVAIDAGTYICSLMALSLLRLGQGASGRRPSMLRSVRDGWSEFTSRTWLVASTIQFTFINFLVWGPFLVLGPVLSHRLPAGARDWGIVMGGYGAGSIIGGLLALGRRPRHPLAAATVATIGYAVPCALFALSAPTAILSAGACVAGVGSTVSGAFSDTTTQQHTPVEVLARVRSIQTFGAFSLGPSAFALAGPLSDLVGARAVLAFGAVWTVVSAAAVLSLPSVREIQWPLEPMSDAEESAVGTAITPGPRSNIAR